MSDSRAFSDALSLLGRGESLTSDQARAAMGELLAGAATPAQIGAFLMGLRVKGETVDEITGLVGGMREAAVKVSPRRQDVVDLCGTGGDGSGTFNISTAASLITAAAGAPVAKHGNRSASSLCGSADVLEALGVPIEMDPNGVERAIDELGFAFLFARTYHPAMRHVAGPRSELKMRTVFNILGPMTNPAGVRRQLLGVFDDALRPVMAGVLRQLGSESVWVVHGEGGLDEISIAGVTSVTVVDASGEREMEVAPEDAGLPRHDLAAIQGGDARANAAIIENVLGGSASPHRDAAVLNAGAALAVQGSAATLREGTEQAAAAIDSGRARELLDSLRKFE